VVVVVVVVMVVVVVVVVVVPSVANKAVAALPHAVSNVATYV
jgi:hypothetical protein